MFDRIKSFEPQPEIFSNEILKALTDKTIEINSTHSMDLEPFIELYTLEGVRRDYAEIAEKMAGHLDHKLSPPEKIGFIFETAFLDLGQNHHWFGEKSELQKASKYDDIKKGIDFVTTVVTEEDTAHHFAIASDLTFSQLEIVTKFNRVVKSIENGNLAEIKYFHSDLIDFTGRLRNVPKTVIGLDKDNLNKLLTRWLNEPELAQLQFAATMLEQIKIQSTGFAKYASRQYGINNKICHKYRTTGKIVDDLLDSKYKGVEIPEDNTTKLITNFTERLVS